MAIKMIVFLAIHIVLASFGSVWAQQGQNEKSSSDDEKIVEFLEFEVGEWDATIEMFSQPNQPSQKFKGEQSDKMRCGKWLITDLKLVGDQDSPPPPYQGHGVLGYDSNQKKFVGSWVDSQQAGIGVCEGEFDPITETLSLEIRVANSETKRFVTQKLDQNHKRTKFFIVTPNSDDYLVAIIDYQRRGKR